MQIGERIGPYEIRDTLGQGGMAQVFKAWHTGLHRFEALKFPMPRAHAASQGERAFISRFLTEARTAASLRHPHIATIYGVSEADSAQPYFAMELVEGSDLADLIHKRGRLTLEETLSILEPVAQALDYAHGRGIIHRDIKPGNVLLEAKAEGWNPKVVDFGIARAMQDEGEISHTRLTQAGAIIGTPEYMSPEQAGNGDAVDYRSDIYALGIVTYEMLCGRPPFSAGQGTSPISVLVQHVRDAPPLPSSLQSDLPARLNDVLLWALAKHPAERPTSCMALVEAMRSLPQSALAAPLDVETPISHSNRAPTKNIGAKSITQSKKLLAVPVLLAAGVMLLGIAALRKNTSVVPAPKSAFTSTPQSTLPPPDPKVEEAEKEAQKARRLVAQVDEGSLRLEARDRQGLLPSNILKDEKRKLTVKSQQALQHAQRALELDPENETAWVQKASILFLVGQYEESEDIVKQGLKKFPTNVDLKDLNKNLKEISRSKSPGASA